MLDKFNNVWIILLAFILLFVIIKKIVNLNKPFDEKRFIEQYQNQIKLKKKFNINNLKQKLPQLASYYIGLH
jgi:flagellar biosynthesis/type III secretory pathway M-ring protein FliF/YscJ